MQGSPSMHFVSRHQAVQHHDTMLQRMQRPCQGSDHEGQLKTYQHSTNSVEGGELQGCEPLIRADRQDQTSSSAENTHPQVAADHVPLLTQLISLKWPENTGKAKSQMVAAGAKVFSSFGPQQKPSSPMSAGMAKRIRQQEWDSLYQKYQRARAFLRCDFYWSP